MKLNQFKRAWAIAKKDLSIYFVRGPTIIFGLLLPAFLFLSFMMGRELPVQFLIPGVAGMALFFSATAIPPLIAPWETKLKTFERLVSTPIAPWAMILGDIIASFLFGLFITTMIVLIGIILIGIQIISIQLIIAVLLASFCFSSMGLLMSAIPTEEPSTINMFSSLIKFPMIFISGVFIPIQEMGALKTISFISPLTYYVDSLRFAIQGESYFHPIASLSILFLLSALFFAVAVKWHEKNLPKRF